jgi:hypothetical protein
LVAGGAVGVSPGYVEVVRLHQDFYGSPAGGPLRRRSSRAGKVFERSARPNDIDRASLEVERARDATHSAVALSRAPSGGNTNVPMPSQKSTGVHLSMGLQTVQ